MLEIQIQRQVAQIYFRTAAVSYSGSDPKCVYQDETCDTFAFVPNRGEETLIVFCFWIPFFTLCRFVDAMKPLRKRNISAVWEYFDLTTENKVNVPPFPLWPSFHSS